MNYSYLESIKDKSEDENHNMYNCELTGILCDQVFLTEAPLESLHTMEPSAQSFETLNFSRRVPPNPGGFGPWPSTTPRACTHDSSQIEAVGSGAGSFLTEG